MCCYYFQNMFRFQITGVSKPLFMATPQQVHHQRTDESWTWKNKDDQDTVMTSQLQPQSNHTKPQTTTCIDEIRSSTEVIHLTSAGQ